MKKATTRKNGTAARSSARISPELRKALRRQEAARDFLELAEEIKAPALDDVMFHFGKLARAIREATIKNHLAAA